MLVLISEFGYDPTNIMCRNGVSSLHVACKKGNLSLVRTLICDYHADLNDRDSYGRTPFILYMQSTIGEMKFAGTEFRCDPINNSSNLNTLIQSL